MAAAVVLTLKRLIEYAEDPGKVLRALDSLEAQVESDFELEVAAKLTRLGYKVVPQWRVGHYRIDIVVVGVNGKRLAVECDGDRYHPIEKLSEDMGRQAVLERLGWNFVRLRGSQFFRDPDRTLEPLLRRLRTMEIEPLDTKDGAPDSPPSAGAELRDRVIRRAHEILGLWRSTVDRPAKTEAPKHSGAATPPSASQSASSARAHPDLQIAASSSSLSPSEHMGDERRSPVQPSSNGIKVSVGPSSEQVRTAIRRAVPESGRIELQMLIQKVAQALGYSNVEKPLWSLINETIGAEVGHGRFERDADWNIWREKS